MDDSSCPHLAIDDAGRCESCFEVVETNRSATLPSVLIDENATLDHRFQMLLEYLDKSPDRIRARKRE